jgi:hypothetical protein
MEGGFESHLTALPKHAVIGLEVSPRDDASQNRRCGAPVGDGSACATAVAADLLPGAGDLGSVEAGLGR